MRVEFMDQSNRDIDRIVDIAKSHMASRFGTLYVSAFQSEEEDEDERPELDEPLDLELTTPDPVRFNPLPRTKPLPLVAVDSGVQELGTLSGGGLALAVRAAAVLLRGESRPIVLRYHTGGIVIDEGNRLPVFRAIGERLGQPTLWVDITEDNRTELADKTPLRPNEVKSAVRSFVERMVTEEAIGLLSSLGGGTLLLDGALPPSSYDLPNQYVVTMLKECAWKKIDVVALSKKTRYTVGGRPIGALFDDDPAFVGYAAIRKYVDSPRARRESDYRNISAAKEVYAARFAIGPTAMTFRVDVHNSISSTPKEVIERVYTDTPLYGGYPVPLIMAHQYSSFLGLEAPMLAADLVARHGLRFEADRTMDVLFQPFNAFGK